jgi:hypothetical protein
MSQHDLVIDNASGAAVRADMNNALAALGSTMKGPNAPPAPTAGMMWWDDDTPSATIWTLKAYDGADWAELGRLNVTTNIFTPAVGNVAWADVASAATTDLSATSSNVRITGTTTITSFGTADSGILRFIRFAAALTLTHNATSLILPGAANITTAAGDTAVAASLGSGNWVVVNFTRAAAGYAGNILLANPVAAANIGINRATALASTSGTSIDFTGIPAGVRRVALLFDDVSVSGAARVLVRLGASSIQTTGYLGGSGAIFSGGSNAISNTTGFIIELANANSFRMGVMQFLNITGNKWVQSHSIGDSAGSAAHGGGVVTLSGALDRLRITTDGADTFDNGSVNIIWEF